jgi:hypothetical protein
MSKLFRIPIRVVFYACMLSPLIFYAIPLPTDLEQHLELIQKPWFIGLMALLGIVPIVYIVTFIYALYDLLKHRRGRLYVWIPVMVIFTLFGTYAYFEYFLLRSVSAGTRTQGDTQ